MGRGLLGEEAALGGLFGGEGALAELGPARVRERDREARTEAAPRGGGARDGDGACGGDEGEAALRLQGRFDYRLAALAARALYAGLGFAEVGARPKYYAGEGAAADALILRAPLASRG